jgi:glycerol-3-phosphate dehydrogenase
MQRDLHNLASRPFDVLVIGGGIHGLTIAYDAAQRGLSVALIERQDFGSGASFSHLRTIHGGLRYLQSFDFRRARESVRERRTLARIAPHAVRPLAFALPLYRSLLKGKLALRIGFLLDRLVAFDRNSGIPGALRIPAGGVTSRAGAIERFPGLGRKGLTGAGVWYDYTMSEADRLTMSWAIGAAEHGAALANYVEATELLVSDRHVKGVRAVDRRTGRPLEIGASVTVNASGGMFDRLLPSAKPPLLVTAMNLVTRRDAGEEALGGLSPSGRHLFLVPCRNRAIFGTWESAVPWSSDAPRPGDPEISAFIAELNQAFRSLDLTRDDVTLVHYGAVPAHPGAKGRPTPNTHDRLSEPAALEGLLNVTGAKYTTARAVAQRVTDRVFVKLRRQPVPCRTASVSLPGGALRDVSAAVAEARRLHDAGLPSDTIPHLIASYGSRYDQVLSLARERQEWRTRLSDSSPVIGAEIVWAVRSEMAITLADAVIRRTPLGAMGFPGDEPLARAAAIAGAELQWSSDRRQQEVEEVRSFYKQNLVIG